MEVICLETKAFYELVDEVVERMMEQQKEKPQCLSADEARGYGNVKNYFQNNFRE